jgi:uncharacterized Zn finger protein
MSWFQWRPYVPVAERRANAEKKMERFRKKGVDIQPIRIEGRKIAQTFWGRAWCDHLEKFSDFANRLPRGRTYVRNGSVCHLQIAPGEIKAMVSGSELYQVNISVKKLPGKRWDGFRKRCAGKIGSLLELLQGRLSDNVMSVVTHRDNGLFPVPAEITLKCSCPDWAVMCKHVAAVLYGVGARLDEKPELLFLLRGVNHQELISVEAGSAAVARAVKGDGAGRIAEADLPGLFGIEMPDDERRASEERFPGQTARTVKRTPASKKTEISKRGAGSGKRKKKRAKPPRQKAQEGVPTVGKEAAGGRSSSPKARKVFPASRRDTTVKGRPSVRRSSPTKKAGFR